MRALAAAGTLLALVGIALAGNVTGIVTEQRSGSPIAGALVTLVGDNGQAGSGQTNERGRYTVEGLAEGNYRARAEARGYEPAAYPRPIAVPARGTVENIDFALVPGGGQEPGGITGRVTAGRSGEPISGALVIASNGRSRFEATSNERGVYVFRGLVPGRYKLLAQARGYEPARYPEPVPVRSGEVTEGINFALVPAAAHGAISGVVTAARSGEPIEGAMVEAVGRNGAGRARTNARGVYVIEGLAAGEYRVRARARGYLPERFPRPVPVRDGEVTEGIDFTLRPGQTAND